MRWQLPDTKIRICFSEGHATATISSSRLCCSWDPLNFSSLAGGNKDVSHSLIRGWQVTQLTPGMGNTWLINCLVTLPPSQRCSQPTVHPQNLTFSVFCSGIWRKAGKPEKHRQQERAPERPRARGTKCRDSFDFHWSASLTHKHEEWNVAKQRNMKESFRIYTSICRNHLSPFLGHLFKLLIPDYYNYFSLLERIFRHY